MAPIQRVLIIGAGPAGLATAIHLKKINKLSCIVYEVRSEPSTLGGAVGIPSNDVRLLDRLGIYEAISKRAAVTTKIVAHSSRGAELGESDLATWSEAKIGYGYLCVKRSDLQDVLLAKAAEEGIQIHYGKRAISIEARNENAEDAEIVRFSDGTTDTADLLLGCDGIHSNMRTLYVDPEAVPEYSGLSAIFSFIPVSDLIPTSPDVTCMHATFTPNGLFAIMPCTASYDTLFWFFSYEVPLPTSENTRDGWEEYKKANVELFKSFLLGFLKDVSGSWGNLLKEVVRKMDVLKFYPLFRLPLGRKWAKGRCLLLGDAAHAMQPHAGQGVSMALEDVFLLSRLLEVPSTTLPDVFEKFDRIRRPCIEKFYNKAATNGDMKRKSGVWAQWIKEFSIWVFLWVFSKLNLQRWGFGQTDLVYDDEVELK